MVIYPKNIAMRVAKHPHRRMLLLSLAANLAALERRPR